MDAYSLDALTGAAQVTRVYPSEARKYAYGMETTPGWSKSQLAARDRRRVFIALAVFLAVMAYVGVS